MTEPTTAHDFYTGIRDAAVARDAELIRREKVGEKILRLGARERVGQFIELEIFDGEPFCFVAEIIHRIDRDTEETLWGLAVAGERVPERFHTLDAALLGVVAYRHLKDNEARHAVEFAARALGVSTEESK